MIIMYREQMPGFGVIFDASWKLQLYTGRLGQKSLS